MRRLQNASTPFVAQNPRAAAPSPVHDDRTGWPAGAAGELIVFGPPPERAGQGARPRSQDNRGAGANDSTVAKWSYFWGAGETLDKATNSAMSPLEHIDSEDIMNVSHASTYKSTVPPQWWFTVLVVYRIREPT